MKYVLAALIWGMMAVLAACIGAAFSAFFVSMIIGLLATIVSTCLLGFGTGCVIEGILK